MKRLVAATLVLLALSGGRLSAQQINTIPGGTGDITSFFTWGTLNPGYRGLGQVFTAPAPLLTDFSFFLKDYSWPFSFDLYYYRAFVGIWDGSSVTSVLWESGDQASSTALTFPEAVTFSPGLALTTGAAYLAYLFPSERGGLPVDAPGDYDYFGLTYVGSGGGLVRAEAPGTGAPGQPTSFASYTGYDAAFIADFSDISVVPEPSTWLMLSTGLLGLGGVALRRRRNDG